MSRTQKRLLAGLALLALSLGLWQWQSHRNAQRSARLAAWQDYLRGPLSDLLEGASRGRALLAQARKRPLSAAQSKELAQAVAALQRSHAGAQARVGQWREDAFFKSLLPASGWHAELADAAQVWPRLAKVDRSLIPAALDSEAAMRRSLFGALSAQRAAVLDRAHPPRDLVLEMNALLYALKEQP